MRLSQDDACFSKPEPLGSLQLQIFMIAGGGGPILFLPAIPNAVLPRHPRSREWLAISHLWRQRSHPFTDLPCSGTIRFVSD